MSVLQGGKTLSEDFLHMRFHTDSSHERLAEVTK